MVSLDFTSICTFSFLIWLGLGLGLGPRLLICLINQKHHFRNLLFELWADKKEILPGQELMSALESFFQLCFSFQLKYPTEVSALDHILQTRVAKYGDENPEGGRLTVLRREPLMNRLAKYTMITKRKE